MLSRKINIYKKDPNFYRLTELKLLLRTNDKLNILHEKLMTLSLEKFEKLEKVDNFLTGDIVYYDQENNQENNKEKDQKKKFVEIKYKNKINKNLLNLYTTNKLKDLEHRSEERETPEEINEIELIFDDISEISDEEDPSKEILIEKIADVPVEKVDKYESDVSEDYSVYEEEESDDEFSS